MGLKLVNLSKSFGKITAVKNLSINLKRGKFLSIVGPSGCGKTTTLRMIAGFTTPDSGEIYIDGNLVNDVPPRKRNIGIVFQNYALFPNLNVFDNIAFGLEARGFSRDKIIERVMELLEITDLLEIKNHFPSQISGGQQQRVALARALAIEPTVLLLDEPLSALDAKVRLEMRYEIKRIQRELSITTIYVTHDQEEALSISDYVAVIRNGEIQQYGKPRDIYNKPENLFVVNFIGVSNILECEIQYPEERMLSFIGNRIMISSRIEGKKGENLNILVRPENIRIAKSSNDKSSNDNILSGKVNGITFLGPIARVRVLINDKKNILVDVPNTPDFNYKVGEEVKLLFNKDVCRVIPNK